MARVAVIGELTLVQGYTLAGAVVHPAEDGAAVRAAWRTLGDDVAVVVLTPRAAACLAGDLGRRPQTLTVVMPA